MPNTCSPSAAAAAANATLTGIFTVGANSNAGVMQCCPVTMSALSPTAAFKNVSFEVQSGVYTYSAAAGQCFGCASKVMAPVQSGAML